MSAQRAPASSVDPWVQANRMENAARGAHLAVAMRNADLQAAGLPPEGLAVIGGAAAGADWAAALHVAAWLADVIAVAGLGDAARALYEAQKDRAPAPGEHVWRARALASQELARRVLTSAADLSAATLDPE